MHLSVNSRIYQLNLNVHQFVHYLIFKFNIMFSFKLLWLFDFCIILIIIGKCMAEQSETNFSHCMCLNITDIDFTLIIFKSDRNVYCLACDVYNITLCAALKFNLLSSSLSSIQ